MSAWKGPEELEFNLDEQHNSLRYNARLITRTFQFYPPPVFIGATTVIDAPTKLILKLESTDIDEWDSRFQSEVRKSVEEKVNYLIYEFVEEKGHSVKYRAMDISGNNALYVPYEFFKGKKYPQRVVVSLSLIS